MKVQNYPNYFFKLRNCQPSAGVLYTNLIEEYFLIEGILCKARNRIV